MLEKERTTKASTRTHERQKLKKRNYRDTKPMATSKDHIQISDRIRWNWKPLKRYINKESQENMQSKEYQCENV